jgi:16S rRNA processing protein RimM
MDDLLEIGRIMAAQGLQGEVRISSESDFPERFEKAGKRWLESPDGQTRQEIMLQRGRFIPGKNIYVVKFAGIDDRTQAEALRGYRVFVAQGDRPRLEADEYHVSDLINLEVYNQITGEIIGTVQDIFVAGNDLLEIKLYHPPEKTILIPFVKEIVPIVNLENKRLEINPPAGLLEINQ